MTQSKLWANKLYRPLSKATNKYMEKTSLATRKMQIKTTLRFYLITVRTAVIKNKKKKMLGRGIQSTLLI